MLFQRSVVWFENTLRYMTFKSWIKSTRRHQRLCTRSTWLKWRGISEEMRDDCAVRAKIANYLGTVQSVAFRSWVQAARDDSIRNVVTVQTSKHLRQRRLHSTMKLLRGYILAHKANDEKLCAQMIKRNLLMLRASLAYWMKDVQNWRHALKSAKSALKHQMLRACRKRT